MSVSPVTTRTRSIGTPNAVATHLRDHGLGALALLGDAGVADDRALRVELHGGAVLRGDPGAADAVEGGARIGHLDEARKADAAIDALLAQPLLLGAQPGVVHHGVEMGERMRGATAPRT